ncbi:Geranylgeranyl transferase type-2 subunit beta 2 [Hondaea fermentalgiana]|uniref:Geranylgeranyl transferase type-2 subunit beta n=1 Tax=Hondaea fermentalgiana TaxID=2315210 RepID=A0A2R5GKG5_9STRA|nr:Geranylgeranyl transferase type-2 subunit beta 2 [Hondaea fermentalgiana]|eukprot:GBG28364.1 Geranylgeranyl transferase type-2 subunit beta 2 [Hondaea fermentalgiana]
MAEAAEQALRARVGVLEAESAARGAEIDRLERELRKRDGDVDGFMREKHVAYVLDFWRKEKETKDTLEMLSIEHIRVQGVFWAFGSLQILSAQDKVNTEEIVAWALKCQDKTSAGFAGNVGHDTNVINTQFAVYVLAQCGALDKIDADAVAAYVAARQQPDGSFADEWSGEKDTRYTCCALFCLQILGRLEVVDLAGAVRYVLSCRNAADGGFGQVPHAESHAAFTYTALGALKVAGHELPADEADELAWWLAERQCDSGGLNGRPEKQADVCYSFWALTCLKMLGRIDWIDRDRLCKFILECQDEDAGGIADRPGNVSDLFHTFFGLCGLELLHSIATPAQISPVLALPMSVLPPHASLC